MKIIISHDVDHIDASDHYLKDLIIPKLLIRSFLFFIEGKISFKTLVSRFSLLFKNKMNHTEELLRFDREHSIPSVFFFGMRNGLGMSYSREKAGKLIHFVISQGFDVGVHGVDYDDFKKMSEEYLAFSEISGIDYFGIRNHYVRYNDTTFTKQSELGYLFDTSWFNKEKQEFRKPYKVNQMWEFPLHIMDGYIFKPGKLKESLEATFAAIKQAEDLGMPYCTILFHDYQFDQRFDPQMKEWYEKTIFWIEEHGYSFVSYREAIKELENGRDHSLCQ